MWLTIHNLWTVQTKATIEEQLWLDEYLSFKDNKSHWATGAAKHAPIKLYNTSTGAFPAGLTGMVMRDARAKGFVVNLIDRRSNPITPMPESERAKALYWLRDYQRSAVETMISKTRGIIWASTGAGKSEVFTGIVRALPGKWVMLVHNKKLVHDAARRYTLREIQWWLKQNVHPKDFDPSGDNTSDYAKAVAALDSMSLKPEDVSNVGIIGDGHWSEEGFTCSTFQTLARALAVDRSGRPKNAQKHKKATDFLDSLDGIIADECHVAPADSFWKVIMAARNAYYRIGLSGTPLARGDRKSVFAVAALGPVQYRIRPTQLIGVGVLAKPKIRMFEVVQEYPDAICSECDGSGAGMFGPATCIPCKGRGVIPPKWQDVQRRLIVRSHVRNAALLHIIENMAARPCLVFVEAVAHGKLLSKKLSQSGIANAFTWGSHSIDSRNEAVNKLVSGEIEVLIASRIFQEGVDVPPIMSVVLASGGKSTIAALQKIGRGMRVTKDKSEFHVFDIYDTGQSYLKRHAQQRRRAYMSEGHSVAVEPPLGTAAQVSLWNS